MNTLNTKPSMTQSLTVDQKEQLRVRVYDWTKELVRRLQEDYNTKYPTHDRYNFVIKEGRKYYKIDTEGQGVHAFVDKNTGEVYKPAGYSTPAKIVRYDLRIIEDRQRCFDNCDWCGSYLYLRG
jgi:hypothetical protein